MLLTDYFANYLTQFFNVDPLYLRVFSILVVFGFACMHIRSVKVGSTVQALITLIKIIPFILIVGVGIFFINPDLLLSTQPISETSTLATQGFAIMPLFSAVSFSSLNIGPLPTDRSFADGSSFNSSLKNSKRKT